MDTYPNKLHSFFKAPKNSVRREAVLLNKLAFDLQLASAIYGQYLKVYASDVDDNGYDILLDTEMETKKLQVKTLLASSKTSRWQISKGLIRPEINDQPKVPLWSCIHPPGIGGGLLVQKLWLKESSIDVEYYYTDIQLITLLALGIIGKSEQKQLALKFIANINSGHYHDKVSISKSLLFKPKGHEELLGLMGIRSRYSASKWRWFFISRFKQEGQAEYIAPRDYLDNIIKEELAILCE